MVILGTMDIAFEKMQDVINSSGEIGYEIVDTAWIYENEKNVGKCVKNYNDQHEKKLKLQTKIWPDFYDNITQKFEEQLKDLQVTKIYSVLLHRPSLNFDLTIKAWKFLIEKQKEGVIEKIGVSNFDKDLLKILHGITGVMPQINQIELSITNFRSDRVYYCQQNNIELQAWSVMGNNNAALNNEITKQVAKQNNCHNSDVAISYLTSQNIAVVVKASSFEHLQQNYLAQKITLGHEDIKLLLNENKYDNKFEESFPHAY